MDFRLSVSTKAIDSEKFRLQFQKAHLYQLDDFHGRAIFFPREKDLHEHEAEDHPFFSPRPNESKNGWKKLEKYSDLFYNWADLENSHALLDEKNNHHPDRSLPKAIFLPFLFGLFHPSRSASVGGHDPHREEGRVSFLHCPKVPSLDFQDQRSQ